MLNKTSIRHLLSLLLLTFLAGGPAVAGVVYEIETTDHAGSGTVQKSEVMIEGNSLKMQALSDSGANEQDVVWQGDKKQMIVIDHTQKNYMVLDKAAIESLLASFPGAGAPAAGGGSAMDMIPDSVKKQMEEQMADMNPQQRKMVEDMLKKTMDETAEEKSAESDTEIRSTGEKATLKNYPCSRYDVMKGETRVRELWVTEWSRIEGGKEAWRVFQDMAGFISEIQEMVAGAAGGGFLTMDDSTLTDFTKLDGFPVVTKDYRQGVLETESILKSASRRDISAGAFEPPAGYSLRTMGPK